MGDKAFLETLVEEISSLDLKHKDATSGEFQAWHTEVLNALDRLFGSNSMEYRSFNSIKFENRNALFSNPTYQKGLTQAEITLKMYLKRLGLYSTEKPSPHPTNVTLKKVFIVYGRDKTPALELARFVEKRYPIEAILLEEQAHKGRTIIEKLEDNSDVSFAFVTLTPDDVGALKGEPLHERGRQNVIFEWGHFIGKLGRKNVCLLIKGDIEIPSDLQGIGYYRFYHNIKECFNDVDNELREANLI